MRPALRNAHTTVSEHWSHLLLVNCVQETPKVDGLAVSFLLSNPEQLNYDRFYDAVISLCVAGCRRDQMLGSNWTGFDAAAVQYHMTICWRLLGCLPPSAAFVKHLEMSDCPPQLSDGPMLLHTIRWVPRLPHKAFQVCGNVINVNTLSVIVLPSNISHHLFETMCCMVANTV